MIEVFRTGALTTRPQRPIVIIVGTRRRTGHIDVERESPGDRAHDGGTHPLLALQRTAGNAAVNEFLRRSTTKREVPVEEEDDTPFDLEEVKARWRERFRVQKGSLGEVTVLHDPEAIGELLAGWDVVPFDDKDYQEARTLAKALGDSTDPEDMKLHQGVVNAVEQQDRQAVISRQLGKLGGRQVLAVLGNGRLEALCVWEVISGQKKTDARVDANWWVKDWNRCFYIEELSSAPWNVGWPSGQAPVRGAGTTLIDEAVKQAQAKGCDGMGLFALPSNVGFYKRVGFTGKEENHLSMTRELKEPSKGCIVS